LVFKDDRSDPAPQYADDLSLLKGCGEDYDLRLRNRGNFTDKLNAVLAGQLYIQDYHRRSILPNRQHCPVGASACRHDDKIGVSPNELTQTRQLFAPIVDENYPGGAGHPISRPFGKAQSTIANRPRDTFFIRDYRAP